MRINNWKEGGVIVEVGEAFKMLVSTMLRPGNIATMSLLCGVGYKAFSLLIKKLDKQQNEMLDKLDSRLDNVEKEILRLQILEGIESKRLSYSEVLYFFDKYKALGGNSFVETRVEKYLQEWNKGA